MEDFGGLIWIAIIWFFASFISSQKRKKQRAEQARRQARARTIPPPPAPKPTGVARRGHPAGPVSGRPDATQREGTSLERMLRQLGADMEQLERGQRGPMGRDARVELPAAEEVEDLEVLDLPVDRGERTPVVREIRAVVDHDEEAEALIKSRLAVFDEHNRPRSMADHRAFDARIRPAPAAVLKKTPRFTARQIRQAVIWREIIGPPHALRDTPDW
ncbi:MAG TPA: hypothetical protein VK845_03350 [Gemmatimonadales bacterium]|nr:hypothetical protein [Gemmatimonadales bacterium]